VLRQFGLSVARSGSDMKRVTFFLEKNHIFYKQLKKKLEQIVVKNNLKIDLDGGVELKIPTGIINCFIRRTCFYQSDFRQLIKAYFFGFKLVETGNIIKNEEWIMLGHELMILTHQLIEAKLSKKERKIVQRVEHFEQNEFVYDKYFSIEEALDLLNK
jgi:hypothetical protein